MGTYSSARALCSAMWFLYFSGTDPSIASWCKNANFRYLEDNKEIRSVCLQGNRIGPRCAPFLGKLIRHNRSITKLDLSTNCLGTGAANLAEALKTTGTLHWLSLRGNQIRAAARQLADGLRLNRSLKALDLSYVTQCCHCPKSAGK